MLFRVVCPVEATSAILLPAQLVIGVYTSPPTLATKQTVHVYIYTFLVSHVSVVCETMFAPCCSFEKHTGGLEQPCMLVPSQ